MCFQRSSALQQVSSYKTILKELDVEASKVLFLSDSILEIVAASEAGLHVCRVDRESIFNAGNVINNFNELRVFKSGT